MVIIAMQPETGARQPLPKVENVDEVLPTLLRQERKCSHPASSSLGGGTTTGKSLFLETQKMVQ